MFYFNVIYKKVIFYKSSILTCRIQIRCSFSSAETGKITIIQKKKKQFFVLSRVYGFGRRKWTLDLDSKGEKKTQVSLQSDKIPLSGKFRADISECCAITLKKCSKTSKMKFFFSFYLFKVEYFDLKNPNLISISDGRKRNPQ